MSCAAASERQVPALAPAAVQSHLPPSLALVWDFLLLSLSTLFPAICASELRNLPSSVAEEMGESCPSPLTQSSERVGYRLTHHVLEQSGF